MRVAARFLALILALVLSFALLAALFVAIVDPYGVSPIRLTRAGFNAIKVKRVDIDRFLKPYEVWLRQPKTIFLGTSRVNQSLNPAILDGSVYAPAYNAAVPASLVQENVDNLEEFFAADHNIKHVFVELFFYNFAARRPATGERASLLKAIVSLNFSATAIRDAIETISYNRKTDVQPAHTAENGQWLPNPWFVPGSPFGADLFIESILTSMPGLALQPGPMAALPRIAELCRKHGATLHLVILPNYPWDDYHLISTGHWPDLVDWLRAISRYPNVLSFSQYNALLEEPANSAGMQWWYDPVHPSPKFGRLILRAIKGERDPDMPANLMEPVTPSTVESVIAQRTAGVIAWAKQHPDFVAKFDGSKPLYEKANRAAR